MIHNKQYYADNVEETKERNKKYVKDNPDKVKTKMRRYYLEHSEKLLDAATEEGIVSCAFLNDRLIVQFERSTWEIVYSQNAAEPFYWQKLNQGLGSQSTFSTVLLDGPTSKQLQ